MKNFWRALSLINKIILLTNGVVGVILLFAYLLPFIPPRYFEYASLSVFTPILMLLNMAFIGIWIIRRQWLFLFSAVLFLIGLPFMQEQTCSQRSSECDELQCTPIQSLQME